MRSHFGRLACIVLMAMLFMAGCAATSTDLTSVWVDEGVDAKVEKVLVVGISQDIENRYLFEDSLVEQLSAKNISAFACTTQIPGNEMPGKEAIQAKAKELGAGHVLVTHLVKVEEEEKYVPPPTFTTSANPDPFGFYYSQAHTLDRQTGYYKTATKVRLETRLFDTESGEPIWKAASDTTNPKDLDDLVKSLGKAVIDSWQKDGLL